MTQSRRYVLALDQGTTSSRAILFDHAGQAVATAQQEFPQLFPQPGWVEHNPADLWSSQRSVAQQVLTKAGVAAIDVAAIGIANQRETVVLWDRTTGQPLCNAIVWQDRRTAAYCDQLKRDGHGPLIQQKTGLVIDAYFSASKIRWLLDHVPQARARAARGELAAGTIDSWILHNLTAGRVHATDVTNASRTMLLNIHTGAWDEELLALFDIPPAILPQVQPSSHVIAHTDVAVFGGSIPIAAMAGDQQAALFGQACFSRGHAKNTYGTGCFLLMNTADIPVNSHHQLLTTAAWQLSGQPTHYALEGSVFVGGAVVQWLRDGLHIVSSSDDIEPLAATVPDTAGVYLVPAFAGLGAPHWDQYARGSIHGLTRGTTAAHLARAAIESIAFQVADILDVMARDSHIPMRELRVDGGAAKNNLLLQFQADLLRVPVVRPKVTETTALGAAYLAGLATGFWKTTADIQANWQVDRIFEPQLPESKAAHRRARWAEALQRSRDWEEHAEADA